MKKTPGTLAAVRIQEGENDVVYLTPRNAMDSGIALKCTPKGFVPRVSLSRFELGRGWFCGNK